VATDTPTATSTGPQIVLDPATVQAGTDTGVVVTGSGFSPGEQVNVDYIASLTDGGSTDESVDTNALDDGTIVVGYLPIPANIAPATYFVVAVGNTSGAFATANLNVIEAGAHTPTDTPTGTPVASLTATESTGESPAGTPTMTATPEISPVATPTATEVVPPITFNVEAVKVGYGSSKPANVMHRASLSRATIGHHVKLIVFGKLSDIVEAAQMAVGFRVTEGRTTVYFDKVKETVSASDDGKDLAWSQLFTAKKKGSYLFTGTLFVGSHHRHKQVSFSAVL
jgi:hypothetical protein